MNPLILFRNSIEVEEEFGLLKTTPWRDHVVERLLLVPRDSLVVGRYSVLPYYQEVEAELALVDSKLVNSYQEHRYIADIENWYDDLSDVTPRTWFCEWDRLPSLHSYVVKGHTNSRKFCWNRQMFCQTREDVPRVIASLMDDSLVRDQGVCVRQYIPLRQFDVGINGLPVTNEWRCFFYRKTLLAYGYYWSNFEDIQPYQDLPGEAMGLLDTVAERVAQHTNFFVVDIAETADGQWIVIELNDGSMSGTSCVDVVKLYTRLWEMLTER